MVYPFLNQVVVDALSARALAAPFLFINANLFLRQTWIFEKIISRLR